MAIDFTDWDKQCEDMASDKEKLLNEMTANVKKEESAEVFYRMAKVLLYLAKEAEKVKNNDLVKSRADKAYEYSDKACRAEPNKFECQKWMCASLGLLANISSSKEKIKYGHQFKEHADIALKLKPDDHFMQSMYGQWCYSVASLGWLERKVGEKLYGKIPTATYKDALNAFKKVHELNPESKDNHLWMARTLIADNNKTEAKQWIQRGLKLNNQNIADELAHKELEELNNKYGK
ncbi:regulator of microtubule dynamics protein 2-like [Oppia nitens]|uniref:regulator of microtubule dynamics protein 2-like n=1 Tax=Oppia nitens TaxID=1686743 RepID=UPI0023DB31D1|nr:regulator of microtubule dynamics protein 2-like [Oppia nitens]